MKDARVLTHDSKVLVLSNLVDPHVKAFGDGNLVRLFIRPRFGVAWGGTHREGTRRNVDQLESDVCCYTFGWWHRSAARQADRGNQNQYDD